MIRDAAADRSNLNSASARRLHRNCQFDKKTTFWLAFTHLGCLAAPFTFTWPAFWIFIALYILTGGLGISMCYHRLLSHRSFKTPKAVEYGLAILGCMAAQRSPVYWVARHRLHHAESDTDNDPHSPRHGFWWAHMIWTMMDLRVADENEFYQKYAGDLARDPGHRWIQKTHELWPVLLAAALFTAGGVPFLVWGFFVRTVVVYHFTWIVNSLGHRLGYKNYPTDDDSRNNGLIALLSFGDGWHNNHHAYPALANHGHHRWWEIDLTYLAVRLMAFLGLASNIHTRTQSEKNSADRKAALKA